MGLLLSLAASAPWSSSSSASSSSPTDSTTRFPIHRPSMADDKVLTTTFHILCFHRLVAEKKMGNSGSCWQQRSSGKCGIQVLGFLFSFVFFFRLRLVLIGELEGDSGERSLLALICFCWSEIEAGVLDDQIFSLMLLVSEKGLVLGFPRLSDL